MKRLALWAALVSCATAGQLQAQNTITLTVEGGKHDLRNVPVCVPLSLTKEQHRLSLTDTPELSGGQLRGIQGQFTEPGIPTEGVTPAGKNLVRRDLHFILPRLKANEKLTLTCKLDTGGEVVGPFHWRDNKDSSDTLQCAILGLQPILRYMHAAYDNSTRGKRDRTYKVFHHLYDPEGKRLVTNGGHTDPYSDQKKLLYPHHRGLMFAYNRIRYGEGLKKNADTWHAKPGDTHQAHEKTLRQEVGTVLGRHRVLVSWHGEKGDVFLTEEREVTAYRLGLGNLIEFASRLKTAGGKVKLDGDPQHAGFQFRAHNDVAVKTAKQTYYLRPDGKGKLDETRNWDPKTKKGPVNLPWDALSFVLDGKRYTVAYLNHPSNPGESRWSERDYGRFGCYFPYELTEERPLVARYRVWLQDGEMTGPQVEALHANFVSPPKVTVK
jgi:hypothetical protein